MDKYLACTCPQCHDYLGVVIAEPLLGQSLNRKRAARSVTDAQSLRLETPDRAALNPDYEKLIPENAVLWNILVMPKACDFNWAAATYRVAEWFIKGLGMWIQQCRG